MLLNREVFRLWMLLSKASRVLAGDKVILYPAANKRMVLPKQRHIRILQCFFL